MTYDGAWRIERDQQVDLARRRGARACAGDWPTTTPVSAARREDAESSAPSSRPSAATVSCAAESALPARFGTRARRAPSDTTHFDGGAALDGAAGARPALEHTAFDDLGAPAACRLGGAEAQPLVGEQPLRFFGGRDRQAPAPVVAPRRTNRLNDR